MCNTADNKTTRHKRYNYNGINCGGYNTPQNPIDHLSLILSKSIVDAKLRFPSDL